MLSGMVPGAALAGVVERAVAPLLAPAPADGGAAGAGSAGAGAADVGFLGEFVDPGEQALVEAAESVVVNGRGAGALVGLGVDALSELVGACGRLAGWAQWAQAVAAACMARCPEMSGLPYQPQSSRNVSQDGLIDDRGSRADGRDDDLTDDRDDGLAHRARRDSMDVSVSFGLSGAGRWNAAGEVACRTGVSRLTAGRVVDRGAGLLDEMLAPVSGLHRVGLLDSSKAGVLVRRLGGEPVGVAAAVQDQVLGRAVRRTCAQVGRDVDRALAALDPEGISRRARRNVASRHVSRPRTAGTGVCEMRALVPRADAILLDATLDAIATSARACGDQRTLGQLRADALTAISLHALRTSQCQATAAANAAADTVGNGRDAGGTGGTGDARADTAGNAGDAGDTGIIETAVAGPVGAAGSRTLGGSECTSTTGNAAACVTSPANPAGPLNFTGFEGPADAADQADAAGATSPADAGDAVYIDEMGLTPDGVPLEGLLGALSGLVCHTGPWWTPSGADPVPLPPGLSVNIDVTVPLDHITSLLGPQPEGSTPHDNASSGTEAGDSDATATGAGPPGTTARVPCCSRGAAASSGDDPADGLCAARGCSGAGATAEASSAPARAAQSVPTAPTVAAALAAPAAPAARSARAVMTMGAMEACLGSGSRRVPVPAAVAVALAAGGTWRRLVTDPLSGAVVDVGRTRYRPPAALADLVRARDRSCTHPGCERPARGCDIDHVIAWEDGGTTSLENLTCLCRAHHRLKHTPGWALTRTPGGALIWRTPSGARYRRESDGSVIMLARCVGPRQYARPATRVPDPLARAITPDVLARLDKGLTSSAFTGSAADHGLSIGSTAGDVAPGPGRETAAVITTRGPRPGENPGDFETTPYPRALHTLGLTPLLDAIPPF